MKRKIFLLLLLTSFSFLASSEIFGQEKKDTIFFDEDWSICEKPVAAYYRICELNKTNQIFYKGDVADYYLNGKIEMTGHYTDKGFKDGEFIFYNANGNAIIKGQYSKNEMSGNWFFNDSSGKLTAEISCKNDQDFTPLLIVDKNGDTTVKDGNGKFVLDMQNQLPALFYGRKNYIIEGEVKDGLKDGNYNCYLTLPKKKLFFSVVYAHGRIKPGVSQYNNIESGLMNIADYQYSLAPSNLVKIDKFNHTNFVFEYNYDAENELIDFLINNETPYIKSRTTNTKQNDELFFNLIENVLYDTLISLDETKDIYYKSFKYPVKTYYSAAYSNDERDKYPEISGNVQLTIDTSGYIVNSAFNSNLTKQQISKINYYLAHVSNLAPNNNNIEKTMYNVNLKLDMLIDTLTKDSFHVSYLIYNADSVNENNLENYALIPETDVEVTAKFPGDWGKYLERNLNPLVPADYGAPNGRYSVTVSFLVDTNGQISDVRADNDPGYGTAQEAIRVISKGPAWIPAIKDGKDVPYRQKQNIVFEVLGK